MPRSPSCTYAAAAANTWAELWCAEVNAHVHAETQAVPDERLRQERPLLRTLPEKAAQATGEVRKVDRFGTVRFGSARYSVPWELVGTKLEAVVDGEEVRL